ncbi:GH92 family glycosyl hydrolase [Puia dinghuensis]|uniref:Alpha-1 2-mannosidase n=1 Tax=Puia dinghuensis TaxID=1792502 RepID=A0A8J2UCW5_9BACT|nr:GH92 family glycosyl hydrolase [Puia dinghuensis]GGA97230.1 alpha-1 2-mannosidase [Puia dinghuensis]
MKHLFAILLLSISATLSAQSPARYIDPTIGNVGALLEPTRPTASLPNQPVRVYPIRKDYLDDQITCFPLTAVSHRLGEAFAIRPTIGDVTPDAWSQRMPYDDEITRPWYYCTHLLNTGITVEYTPGRLTGFYRFTFPENTTPSILLDKLNGGPAGWHFTANDKLDATETWQGNVKIYAHIEFTTPGKPDTSQASPAITFPAGTTTIGLRYAISFISPDQAEANFQKEIAHTTFDAVKLHAEQAWSNIINRIRVEGGIEAQRRVFYTALYRCHERMVDITEDGRYYSGYSHKIETDSRPFYVDDWSWDTYLALHPLRTILHPAQEEDMLDSYVRMYKQSGWMPTFPVLFGDYACMNGFHSTVIFLDAWRKGLRKVDMTTAYEGMRKNATDATLLPWRNGPATSLDSFYRTNGWFPALRPGEKESVPQVHPFERRQAVAVTLGASYDDWALQQLAKDLGKTADAQTFAARAHDYTNLWSPERKFFLPKDDKGAWIDIDPKFDGGPGGRDYYDENNGYTYLWQVQENIPALIHLMGGKKAAEERLDQLFREGLGRSKQEFWNKFPDATGLVGQYSMANEPSFHIPYLYNYVGTPWKTQEKIRLLLSTWFRDDIFGIPGDEDGGGMSAFVVFSCMGFYPVTPGLPVYTIGSPVFSKVTIALDNGKQFTLIAHHCSTENKYIQSARIDGVPLKSPWFTHRQLMAGGTLELEMGPKPNTQWGVEATPPGTAD